MRWPPGELGGTGEQGAHVSKGGAELDTCGVLVGVEGDAGADLAVLAALGVTDAGQDGAAVAGQVDDDLFGAVLGEVAAVVASTPRRVCGAGAAGHLVPAWCSPRRYS
jgi:hypothetical protein